MFVQIENTNHCNARCVWCAHSTMEREQGVMAWGLYTRIVDELTGIGPLLQGFCLCGLGEPMLDPGFFDKLQYARDRLQCPLTVYTNGSLITDPEHLATLVDELYISLNAIRAEDREAIMGLRDYQQVADVTRQLIEQASCRVWVAAVADKGCFEPLGKEAFQGYWGSNAFLHLEGNWAGKMWPMVIEPIAPCIRPFNYLHVLWNGQVALCCFDAEGECILGDLSIQSVMDVWNGEARNNICQQMDAGQRCQIPLCRNCSGI